jgi:hypothetical protein
MMIDKKLDRIDEEIRFIKTQIEFGGPEVYGLCERLENVTRDLKVFDQREHRQEKLAEDLNKRFEAIVLSLEKITKVLKENRMI